MKNNSSSQQFERKLAQIMPIVRGLLAEETGDGDIPYEPVILKSLTSKEAIDGFDKLTTGFAGSSKNAKQVGWGLHHRNIIGGLKPTLQTSTQDRLSRLRKMIAEAKKDVLVGVDGGITRDNITNVARMDVDIIVTGSAVFDGKTPLENAKFMISAVKDAAQKA